MKHGRPNLPFVRRPGHVYAADDTLVQTMQYVATCDCGAEHRIAAPRNLPDAVAVRKFEQAGWVGTGHARKGIPRDLHCPRCATPQPKMELTTMQTQENHHNDPVERRPADGPLPYWRLIYRSLTEMVRMGYRMGATELDALAHWIEEHYSGTHEISRAQLSSILSRVRLQNGGTYRKVPGKRRARFPDAVPEERREEVALRRIVAEVGVEAPGTEPTPPDLESVPRQRPVERLVADALELQRMLHEWIVEARGAGLDPHIAPQGDAGECEGIIINLRLYPTE